MTRSRLAPLSRHAAVALLTSSLAVVWLGACSSNSSEACGAAGLKNGTCQVGPTCSKGTVIIPISDPVDECPGSDSPGGENYICCGPPASDDAGTTTTSSSSTASSSASTAATGDAG